MSSVSLTLFGRKTEIVFAVMLKLKLLLSPSNGLGRHQLGDLEVLDIM